MTWKAFDYLSVSIAIIGGIALVALVVLTGWQVWGRYVMNDTPTWAERLSLLLIRVVALPLSAVGLRENFHLGISMVVDKLPDALRHAVALFVTLLLGGFGLAMAVFGWQLVAGTWNRNIPLLNVPIAFALGIAALLTAFYDGVPSLIVFQRMVAGMNVFSLLAIKFFIFAGELMMRGGIAMRLVRFAQTLVGQMRGGLGLVNVLSSMLFGGISGSAVADASALGSVMIPMMRERNYDDDYSVNVTVTASIAGIMIPPSHNMILYALAAGGGMSISALFLAGVVPGIIMCLCLGVAAYAVAVRRGAAIRPRPFRAGLRSLPPGFRHCRAC